MPSAGGAPTVVAPGSTPTAASSTHVSAEGPPDGILASYVGPALRWSGLNVMAPNGLESWDNVDKGCQLGNYEPTLALCRAAKLAAGGWSGMGSIPFGDIAEFCTAGYLKGARALCWWAQHGGPAPDALSEVDDRAPGKDSGGIPEADGAEGLAGDWALLSGPHDKIVYWRDVKSSCARGAYPLASPLCQADSIHESEDHSSARVAYPIVASFCDVGLIRNSAEVCRAAYRSVGIRE